MTTSVVTAQFAIRSFPTAERLSRRRDSGVDSKGVQQSIGRKRTQEAAIGFHRSFAGTLAKSHLLHREWTSFPCNFLATCVLAGWPHCIDHRILRQQTLGY